MPARAENTHTTKFPKADKQLRFICSGLNTLVFPLFSGMGYNGIQIAV